MISVTVINKLDMSRKNCTFLVLPRKDEWIVLDDGDLFSVHGVVHLCTSDSHSGSLGIEIYVVPE